MKLTDLDFSYPEELIATSPQRPSRVMWVDVQSGPSEISLSELLEKIPSGDLLVLNNTRVLKRRVFSGDVEIFFLKKIREKQMGVFF
jgi:S-adenosylmethionine:tRNA ribosyltransferase-isomerase